MILLDTQTAVWLTIDKRRLSLAAREAVDRARRADSVVAIGGTTLWEIAMLSVRGRIRLPISLKEYLLRVESMFVVLPITGAIAEQSMAFTENFPRDPADRLIAATAVVHGLKLVTADEAIRRSEEVDCVW